MFRRSVLLFSGFGLLCLVLIVGYALTGLSGPEAAVERAEQHLADRRPDRALADLFAAERTLGSSGSPELQRRILRARLRAHQMSSDTRRALATLGELIERFGGELPLEHERLRLWIASGDAERALERARELLRRFPDDGRTLELAGEATQRVYQEQLAELARDLSAKLPPVAYRHAVQALLPYLYRREDDPVAANGKLQFDEILQRYSNIDYVAEAYKARIDMIRERVAQALAYYQHSLEAPPIPGREPVSAFRGLAYGLDQGRRYDDLLALSEVYLRRFDHKFAMQAAITAARVHEQAGRHAAVIELCHRFLPRGSWRERLQENRIDAEVRHLLLCEARALHASGDARALAALSDEVVEMAASGKLDLEPQRHLIQAYERDLAGDPAGAERLLTAFVQHPSVRQLSPTGEDLFTTGMRMRLAAARRAGLPFESIEPLLAAWIDERPDDSEPLLERARARLAAGQPDEAFYDATRAMSLAGHDEEALQVYAAAADTVFAASGRDAAAKLAECIALPAALERLTVANPALWPVLAERALRGEHYDIARHAARQAAHEYNWAAWPRELWCRAAMAQAGAETDPDVQRSLQLEAVRAMEAQRRFHPDDAAGLGLLRRARKLADLPVDDLLYDLALAGTPDPDVARGLLAKCLARGDVPGAAALTKEIRRRYGRDPEVALLIADVLIATGDLAGARTILAPMAQVLVGGRSPIAPRVAERLIGIEARIGNANAAWALLPVTRELHREDADALFRMARALARTRHHHIAYAMLQPLLDDPIHATARCGAHFVLAGELALRTGDVDAAREHFTRALSFSDNLAAGRPLALLLLRDGEIALAADVPWDGEIRRLADAALAVRLGRGELADAWIVATQQRDPLNLAAACLRAVRQDRAKAPPEVLELARSAPETVLDVLLFPEVPGFEEHGLERADELRAAYPGNAIARYLWARAAARAGRHGDALEVLWQLADDYRLIAAYDEIVRILAETDPAALRDKELNAKVAAVVSPIEAAAPPRLRAMLLANFVYGLTGIASAPPSSTVDLLAQLWLEFHEETRSGWPQLQALVELGRHRDALDLFDLLEPECPPSARPELLRMFAKEVRKIVFAETSADVIARATERVRGLIASDGPYGGLVHVLLDQQDRVLGPIGDRLDRAARARIEAEKRLLEGHLALVRQRGDPDLAAVVRTLQRLRDIDGSAVALVLTEDLLRHDPSLLPVWLERARLLEAAGHPADAVAGLRWLFDYVNDADVLLEASRIAGQAGIVAPADEQRLLRDLAPWAAKTPRAAFARGLLALRLARYEEAARMLEEAQVRPDGAHLFYRALANLTLPDRAAGALAAQLLTQFARRYPKTRVCEIAAHLAAQLALPGADT